MTVKLLKPYNLYLPALVIVAVILVLLIFVGFSTYWNLDRARRNALLFVNQQGNAIADILESSILSIREMPDKKRSMERLVEKTGENKAVTYVYIADDNENMLYHSHSNSIESVTPVQRGSIDTKTWWSDRSGHGMTYEIVRRLPLQAVSEGDAIPGDGLRSAILVVGMEMQTFEEAMMEDMHHALVMVSILVALGMGSAFFIFVINRYHRINRDLKENQEYTRQVVENMANGLLSIDHQGRIVSANAQGLYLLGIHPEEAVRMNLDRYIDFEAGGILETLEQGTTVIDREVSIRHESGQPLPVALSVTPILSDAHRHEGAVVLLRDLREVKQLEERIRQSEQLAALGRMSAAVAHEIRNPLSSIKGFAQFLAHVLKDKEKEREYALIMVREVDRMNRVVTDLLNFARPLEIDPTPAEPCELLSHTLQLVKTDADSRGVKILLDCDVSGELVSFDSGLMTQVLLNLLLNAIQSVEDKGHVSARVKNNNEGQLVFEIEDDGPGIAESDLQLIFEPFFTTRETGTGLGLSIVRKIVEKHGGDVQVSSPVPETGRGCRFTVTLPGV